MRSFMRFIACFIASVSLVGCGGATLQRPQDSIVGKWRVIELNSDGEKTTVTPDMANSLVYEFFADGSITIHWNPAAGGSRPDVKGTYMLRENGQLAVNLVGMASETWDASIDSDRLTLKESSSSTKILQRE